MSIKINPYFIWDGIPSMRDSHITTLYNRMVDDGTIAAMNYEGDIPDAEALLKIALNAALFAEITFRGEHAGVYWLNRFEHRRAHIHFCMFKKIASADKVLIGKQVLDDLFKNRSLEMLWGIVPKSNKAAVDFAVACGGIVIGAVPGYIWNIEKLQPEDGIMLAYTGRGIA